MRPLDCTSFRRRSFLKLGLAVVDALADLFRAHFRPPIRARLVKPLVGDFLGQFENREHPREFSNLFSRRENHGGRVALQHRTPVAFRNRFIREREHLAMTIPDDACALIVQAAGCAAVWTLEDEKEERKREKNGIFLFGNSNRN